MRYILMTIAGPEHIEAWKNSSADDKQREIADAKAWFGKHGAAGRIVGGEELGWPHEARTVRKKGISDGPFIETKEMLGGLHRRRGRVAGGGTRDGGRLARLALGRRRGGGSPGRLDGLTSRRHVVRYRTSLEVTGFPPPGPNPDSEIGSSEGQTGDSAWRSESDRRRIGGGRRGVRTDRRLSDGLPALPPPDIPPEGRHAAGECLDVRRSISDDHTVARRPNGAMGHLSPSVYVM